MKESLNLLIVEDEELAARKLNKMVLELEPNMCCLAITDSIAGTVSWLKENGLPDLILMDIDLPDLNGLQITRRLKASPSMAAIPIVMITGHSGRQVLHASLSAGAIDFLVKPFDREVLLQKLARHLAR